MYLCVKKKKIHKNKSLLKRQHFLQTLLLYFMLNWSPAVKVETLPGIDEILSQADVSRGPCDGYLPL